MLPLVELSLGLSCMWAVLDEVVRAVTKMAVLGVIAGAPTAAFAPATPVTPGPGARNQAGETVKMTVKEGDKVLLPEFGGEKIKLDEQEFFLFRETELLGVLS